MCRTRRPSPGCECPKAPSPPSRPSPGSRTVPFTVSPLWRRWYFHHELVAVPLGRQRDRGLLRRHHHRPDAALPTHRHPVLRACTNLQTSALHCGMCNRACPAGETCNAGVCGLACPAGQTACTGRCVTLNTDSSNCGACGRTCIGGQWCIAGACGGGTPLRRRPVARGALRRRLRRRRIAARPRLRRRRRHQRDAALRHALVGRRPLRGDAHVHQLQRQRAGQHQLRVELPRRNHPQRGLPQQPHGPAVARPPARLLGRLRGHGGHRAWPPLGRPVGRRPELR
ncbi:MAG: hypothetical protein IPN17_02445 [Deltaproteobacteria bacterium]|nr:hypothetical protein [Deltaproteobacteria bacterium]